DGLIVTGTEPKAPDLKDEPYWNSLTRVLEWAEDHTYSTILSCLAAHAGILHIDGIVRRPLGDKRFGVFECVRVADHPLTAEAPRRLQMPHSRWNEIPEEALLACGYRVLTRSADAGVDAFVKQRKSLFVFFQGHPEYEAITILLVILHNERSVFPSLHLERLFANGWMGVDLFFVLSGFLITGILLDSTPSDRYVTNFYARRCLRIWPLYYALLVFMFVIVPRLRPSDAHAVFDKSSPWWAYPLFLQNVLLPSPTNAAGPLAVTWSLAIEEQFYLVWPWVVRYASRAQIRRLALLVIGLSPALRLALSAYGVNLYTNVFCRLDGLM